MELAVLRSFVQVAERGSLTLAAQDLGLTQPGLTRQIQKLERELGVPLFVRSREGMRLTPAGERVLAYAQEVLARHHQLLEELQGAEAAVEGPLRIVASTTPAEFLVPDLVAAFTARYPQVQPFVYTTDSQGVIEELLARRWDLGFVGARIERKELRFDPVAEDEVVLAVPAHHPFAREREVPLDALANQSFVEREGGSGTLLSVRHALAQRGLALPPHRVAMTLSTTQAIVSAVRAGYGIGFVTSLALADRSDPRVVAVRLAGIPLFRTLYLVREERRLLPPPAQRFVAFVLETAPRGLRVSATAT
ncbi:MAG TPA: LysR family transcriptional regulator [Chloroflexota bacterium]|nr:LysR family transcriptional regulator [Chloroflexota bacterium]